MIKTCLISDTHGFLPEIPDCDLLLHGGDILPLKIQRDPIASMKWLRTEFTNWINEIESKGIKFLACWGNHDFIGEKGNRDYLSDLFLTDRGITFKGLKIYGTPYQKYFGGWAFNLHDDVLAAKYDLIPENADILLVHNPPYGILDVVEEVVGGKEIRQHCGSKVLKDRLDQLPNIRLVCMGHIHSGRGVEKIGDTIFVNASICDENYKPINKPIMVDI